MAQGPGRRRKGSLRPLDRVLRAIMTAPSMSVALQAVADGIIDVCEYAGVSITVVGSDGSLQILATAGQAAAITQQEQKSWMSHRRSRPSREIAHALHDSSGRVVGSIVTLDTEGSDAASATAQDRLGTLITCAGIAIETAAQREQTRLDYDEIMQERDRLKLTGLRVRQAFDEAPIGMALVSLDPKELGRCLLVNEALSKMTGYPVPKLLGMSVLQIIGSEERSGLHSSLTRATLGRRTPIRVSTRYQPASGDRVWAELTTTPVLDEDGTARTGISCLQSLSPRDTPEVERSARHDSQTGLLTPAALRQELADALHRSRRFDTNGALFVAQIEHVDPATRLPVADQEGDLFAMAARRLAAVLRAEDSITRLDDNTVAVLIEEISVSDASGMSERIGAALRQLVTREGRAIETRADIGVAVLGDQCDDADAVLTQVDVALKRAKRIGPNTHVLFERVEDPPVKPQQAKQPLYSRSAEEAHNHS